MGYLVTGVTLSEINICLINTLNRVRGKMCYKNGRHWLYAYPYPVGTKHLINVDSMFQYCVHAGMILLRLQAPKNIIV